LVRADSLGAHSVARCCFGRVQLRREPLRRLLHGGEIPSMSAGVRRARAAPRSREPAFITAVPAYVNAQIEPAIRSRCPPVTELIKGRYDVGLSVRAAHGTSFRRERPGQQPRRAASVRSSSELRTEACELQESTLPFDYQAVAGDYQYRALHSGAAMQRFWHGGKLDMIDHLIRPHLKAGSRLLEIGCGAGNLLVEATVPGSFPVALDLARPSLNFVRSRLREARSGPQAPARFGCIEAVGGMLPLADDSFECVLLAEVIEHLEAPQTTVREASRVLRPGGRLLVTTPNYRSLWPLMEWTVDRLNMAPKMAGEQHIARFHPASLHQLLVDVGLRIEYFGTIYGMSPFAALASAQWARRQLVRELDRRSLCGMIIVAVAVKRPS
jgi:SAM-dependent methyltransferase